MTIEHRVTGMTCDHPGCYARLDVPGAEKFLLPSKALRALAAAWCRWSPPNSNGDFCPTHKAEHL